MTTCCSIVRVGIIALVMALTCAARANASLIKIDFATTVNQGGFINTPFSGGFIYDDLGTGNCLAAPNPYLACNQALKTPIMSLWLRFGTNRFGLSDLVSPTPAVLLPLGSNGWGPVGVSVRPSVLPAGLTSLSLGPGAAVFTLLEFSDDTSLLDQPPLRITTLPASIPGPPTAALLGVGLALAAFRLKRSALAR